MMTGRFVGYLSIKYEKRIGKTKVKIFKDSLRTLQYILEAILYYNPIKIYIVFSLILIFISIPNLILALFTKLLIAYIIGVAAIILALFNMSIGLLSIQLKQLLTINKNSSENERNRFNL
jgi:hypothetical protein